MYQNGTVGIQKAAPGAPASGDRRALRRNRVLKGARVIEKHFTDDKTLPGNDHYHAMDANDLRVFRRQLAFIATLGGQTDKTLLETEQPARLNARRTAA